jgi:sulfur-oxidizing protein SoxY
LAAPLVSDGAISRCRAPRHRWPPALVGLATAWLLVATAPAAAQAGAPATALSAATPAADATEGDPFKSLQWPELRKEFLGAKARAVFDERVRVLGPVFAEDPMNVPVTISTDLPGVQRVLVLVDRNPIRKVLELQPLLAQPAVSFRFKLEQASPVRAAVLTADGLWHVGGALIDSAGGGCTAPGATRADGSWTQTLGQVSGRLFSSPAPAPGGEGAAASALTRLRLRVMHPMDTGLVGGVPAFYVSKLSVRDAQDQELLRLATFEPISENPVFSFDFSKPPLRPLRISGVDNNGNRIDSKLD